MHAYELRIRVLQDVRHRLLRDAVEHRLRLRGQTPVPEVRADVDRDAPLFAAQVAEALDCGDEAEVVERRRPELDRKPPYVLQGGDDQFATLGDRSPALVRLDTVLERLQPEQDRRQRLAGLVVELPCEPGPL